MPRNIVKMTTFPNDFRVFLLAQNNPCASLIFTDPYILEKKFFPLISSHLLVAKIE
jgi:hypothetical protein